jgi:branched-chain amino acid transport system substrate-binding protein
VAVVAAVAAIGSGCASPGSGIQPGEHVSVYVSAPLRGAEGPEGRDVADGARLALADAGGGVGGLTVRAVYLDDAAGSGSDSPWRAVAAAANARRAAEDSTSIAYVGDFDSGATRFSLPITNEARMLQVSPASSAIDLVQPYLGAGDQMPDQVQPSGGRTFGRVIPSDEAQARAGAGWAKRLGTRRALVASDRSEFGAVMRSAFSEQARALGIRVTGGLPELFTRTPARLHGVAVACDAVLIAPPLIYAAGARPPVGFADRCGRMYRPKHGLMASDALLSPGALAMLGPLDRRLLVTSAALDPSELPVSGQRFVRAFRGRYRRPPGRYAAYGYEAMAVVLDSIRRAGDSGDDRDSVLSAFFETRDRHSILGTYSIDDLGNTTLNRMTGYRVVREHVRAIIALKAP